MSADHYQKNRQIWYSQILHLAATCQKLDRKSTRLNSSHDQISYAVFCLKKKKITNTVALISPTNTCLQYHRRPVSSSSICNTLGCSFNSKMFKINMSAARMAESAHTVAG